MNDDFFTIWGNHLFEMLSGFLVKSTKIYEVGDDIYIAVDFEVLIGLFSEIFGNGRNGIGLIDAPTDNMFIGHFTSNKCDIGTVKGCYHRNCDALLCEYLFCY